MGEKFLGSVAVAVLLVVTISGQGRKRPTSPTTGRTSTTARAPLPSEYEIKAVILPGQGVFIVGIEPNLDSPASLNDSFQAFFQDHFGTRPRNSNHALPKVVVEFGEDDKIEDLVKGIKSVQVTPKIVVELQSQVTFTTRFILPPPTDPSELLQVRPNPLTLIVKVDDQHKVSLNGDEMGSLANLSQVSTALQEIFREREKNGVFRSDTNEIEKTVFIDLPLKAPAADLLTIGKALKDAGSDRIGLATADLPVDTRKELEEVPLAPPPKKKPNK